MLLFCFITEPWPQPVSRGGTEGGDADDACPSAFVMIRTRVAALAPTSLETRECPSKQSAR